jgi:alpha-L-arabinofuranosidase
MKILISFLLLLSVHAYSQTSITVDAGKVLRPLSGHENGINLDYLMDGSYLNPAISPTQSLKNNNVTLLRYPGGEKSDNYLFSKAPYTSASPRMALNDTCFWPTNDYKFVDTNSADKVCWPTALDFDEYITVCNNTGAVPLIVVAYDAAYNTKACVGKPSKAELLTNAVEWVRYANIKKGWKVKYWMIGNESWHNPEYNGRVTPAKYADDLADFASAMKAVDPSIKIIANGRSDWWQTILQSSAVSQIDFLAMSEYPVLDYVGGYEYYRKNDVNLTDEIDNAINDINTYAPVAHRDRIKVIASEYSSIDWNGKWPSDNNLGHALANFQMFGDLVIKPKLETACMWNTRWVENAITPFNLYDAFDSNGNMNAVATPVNVWGTSLLSFMVEAKSNDPGVKSYASYDSASNKLNILLLNKDITPRQANIDIKNYLSNFSGEIWQLKGSSVDDRHPKYERTGTVNDSSDVASLSLPANSVLVLKLQTKSAEQPNFTFSFQPNPFNWNPKIKVMSIEDTMMTIVVSDIMGRIVHRENRFLWKGENVVDMKSLTALQNGVYFVKVTDNQHMRTLKIIRK